jgi:hypothetical protein
MLTAPTEPKTPAETLDLGATPLGIFNENS